MENKAAATARAFTTYSLVPYLGVLFSPGALLMSSVAIIRTARISADSPDIKAETLRRYAWLALSFFVLLVQVMLWWILYKVPQWAKGL